MALAIDTGDDEELAAVRKKLKVALTAGVELEEAPDPLLEDYEAALSVSAFETTEATPTSPDPMAATPPAIGTVSAPNAESIDRTDIATTSWGGVPGSPKKPARLAVVGSGSPPGMGADACPRSPVFGGGGYNLGGGMTGPRPVRAASASMAAATAFGGSMAGPTPVRAAPALMTAGTTLGGGIWLGRRLSTQPRLR